MSQPIIEVDGLSKCYRLGMLGAGSLREDLSQLFKRKHSASLTQDENARRHLWAIREVSFSVTKGEVLGIIGRNGAGKSTLLKILSRVTEPTSGRAVLRGRIASLLEVGTGFHPELSGRENIFLNGCLMGLNHREVKQRFEQIVEFAGVERFIDTPIKRYSSGMHVRLGFAVAAHLDPEIIIIDEVLAVGDSEFQKKCINRIQEVARGGGTIIFVSHNVHSILRLCNRCVLLKNGSVADIGPTSQVVDHYLKDASQDSVRKLHDLKVDMKPGIPHLRELELLDQRNKPTKKLRFHEPFRLICHIEARELVEEYSFALRFNNRQHELITATNSRGILNQENFQHGRLTLDVLFENFFIPGHYYITAVIWGNQYTEHYEAIFEFEVSELPFDAKAPFHISYDAQFAIKADWKISTPKV